MEYRIPIDYDKFYKNRIIIITGVGRSGTTQLGRILGSMQNTCYVFEPAIMKLLTPLATGFRFKMRHYVKHVREAFRATFFEDYCLPVMSGRNTQPNPDDWTYIHDYISESTLKERWKLARRKDAVDYILQYHPWWIIKSPEALPLLYMLDNVFCDINVVHIIRDGLKVVQSAKERGWYTDKYLEDAIVDWVATTSSGNIPWIAFKDKKLFKKYNSISRIAYIWRCCTQIGRAFGKINPKKYTEIRYEEMCKQPAETARFLADKFDLKWTATTEHNVANTHEARSIDKELIEQMQEPERSNFIAFRKSLGY